MDHATLAAVSTISPAQCRAARGLLNWSREQLAEASFVAIRTIVDFERGARQPRVATVASLGSTFETAGVAFIPESKIQGAGVRLSKRPAL